MERHKLPCSYNREPLVDPRNYINPQTPSNIVYKLASREIYGRSGNPRIASEACLTRSMYQNIVPNFSVTDVVPPRSCLRTFTPDGKHLIGFDAQFGSSVVQVYSFRGPEAANDLFASIKTCQPNWIQNNAIRFEDRDGAAYKIRRCLFDSFFDLLRSVTAAPPGFDLSRECSLITSDSRFLIVGSLRPHNRPEPESEQRFNQPDADSNSNSNTEVDMESGTEDSEDSSGTETTSPSSSLGTEKILFTEDYCVSVIDINRGEVVSSKIFSDEKIILTHNQGIYLYKSTLTIFSVKYQTIHVLNLSSEGVLRELRSIGRFADEAGEELFNAVPEFRWVGLQREHFLSSLSQKLLQYVFEHGDDEEEPSSRLKKPKYYTSRQVLDNFRISKTQLLDEATILLKYSARAFEHNPEGTEYHFFVFYDLRKSKILKVNDIYSVPLGELVSTHTELFRGTHLIEGGRHMTNPGNSVNCRTLVTKMKAQNSNYHSLVLTHHLTSYCQAFTPTPYLDHNLFIWDPNRVNLTGRPRAFAGAQVPWLGASSNAFNFHLTMADAPGDESDFFIGQNDGNLFKLVFHSHAPFIISLQRSNRKYYLNFHFRLNFDTGMVDCGLLTTE